MGEDEAVEELFAAVSRRAVASYPDVESGRILHSTGLKTNGKFFAFVARGELVVKLPGARVDELVDAGAERFDANKGRPMREWVRLRLADEQQCEAYAAEARAFVAGEA